MSAVRVEITLNEDVLQQVIDELELKNPPTFTMNGSQREMHGGVVRGTYAPATNHVTVVSQNPSSARESLLALTHHLSVTVLHELRHAWQRENWDAEMQRLQSLGPYEQRGEEIDARAYSERARKRFPGLVRVKKTQAGTSGFSRLGTVRP